MVLYKLNSLCNFRKGPKSVDNVTDYNGARDAEAMEQYILDQKKLNEPVKFEQMVN